MNEMKAKTSEKTETAKGSAARTSTRAHAPSPLQSGFALTDMQQAAGNLAMQRFLRTGMIQAKLTVSSPGNMYEQEADRVADHVLSSASIPSIQRKCAMCPEGMTCPKCEEEERLQAKESPGRTPHVMPRVESSLASLRGNGQPLPASVRAFFEPRFGQDFSQVRVHTGALAAETAKSIDARAFTIGRTIAFGAGQYAPESCDGQRLLAHELTHVLQQSGDQVQRQPAAVPAQRNPEATKRVQDAITERKPDMIAALSSRDIAQASAEERLMMIDILLDGGNFFQKFRVAELWDTFGKGIVGVANANPDRWRRSWVVAAGQMRTSSEVKGQETYFLSDVEAVARGYLDQNEQFCKDEAARLGLGESGEIITGPPTLEQSKALASMRDDASKIAATQEAMRDLRRVKVGYEVVSLPPGGTGPMELGNPTMFDPDKPPNFPPPESEPNRKTWEEVKKVYDDLDMLMQARLQMNPGLYPLVRGAKEDPAKTSTVAGGTREQALTTIGAGLKETQENIAKTRPMLKTVAPDLEPIHGQLLSGSVSVGGRNWKAMPFYEAIGRDLVERRKPGPWWAELGLMAAHMGVYVIAGLATGGTALAIGLAVKGTVDVALAKARADVLESAAKTNVTAETALVTEGQVDEAKGELIMTAAFALVDIATGAGAVRGALRSVRQFEQEAAKAAARAAAAADKAIAKHSTKEAAALAQEAKQAAAEAKAAANKASSAAGAATGEEAARAAESSRQAASSAEAAERKAADVAALASEAGESAAEAAKHPPAVIVGKHTLKVRGNWIVRCSPPPCAEFAAGVAERARRSASELGISGVVAERVGELRPRLNASASRATKLAAQAEAELAPLAAGDPKRIMIEKRLQEEAALIELDVQATEKQFIIEGVQQGELPRGWGEMVHDNAVARMNTTWRRASGAGARKIPKQLEDALNDWRGKTDKLLADARELEAMPPGPAKTSAENGLVGRAKRLDEALEGIEREERVRRDLLQEGGVSLGESDKEIMDTLGTTGGPDFGRIKGDTMVLAESKGKLVGDAIDQFATAMNAPKLPPGVVHFDLRIYLKPNVWEELLKTGNVGEFSAKRIGDNWYIMGQPKVRGNRVLLLPG